MQKAILATEGNRKFSELLRGVREGRSYVVTSFSGRCQNHRVPEVEAVVHCQINRRDQCRLLLSEYLQEGFTWRGVTVVNPFAAERNELLREALDS